MLRDEKILITGPAGQIAFPIAESLSKENEVWGIARFGDAESRERVEAVGVTTVT
jgi:nucleoside-diphosphate-sugar epimerase